MFVFAVFITSWAQVLLKVSADKEHKNVLSEYLNLKVISAYSISVISIALTLYAYRGVELRFTPMLDALAYVFVPILSMFVLREKLNGTKIIGIGIIVFGMVLFGAFH